VDGQARFALSHLLNAVIADHQGLPIKQTTFSKYGNNEQESPHFRTLAGFIGLFVES